MKIVIVSLHSKFLQRGAEIWAADFKKALDEQISVKIVSSENMLGFHKRRNQILSRLFLDKYSLEVLVHTLQILSKCNDCDIIIPVNGGWQTFIVRIWSFFKGIKMAVVGHSGLGFDDRFNLYCFPDLFISLSKAQKKWAQKVNPFVNVEISSNGVFLNNFNIPKTKRNKISNILYVGALEKNKNPQIPILVAEKLSHTKLTMLGDGYLKTEITHLGNEVLGSDRFTLKRVKHNEISEYYSKSDCLLMPSPPHEAFGIVLLEAMASGLPVVTYDSPIRREILGKAGVFVNTFSVDEFAKACQNAFKISSATVLNQVKRYDWSSVSLQYIKIFKKLINGKNK